MTDAPGKGALRRLTDWVNGEREPKDQTLFVMEKRRLSRPEPTETEHAQRERSRLHRFLRWYPAAAVLICLVLSGALLCAVLALPAFGDDDAPIHNEVAEHYLEYTREETGAANAVTGMILTYRGFDTLGESCVLFLAVSCVMLLLRREDRGADDREEQKLLQEDAIARERPDRILQSVARILTPFLLLFALYVLLGGENSPGGGFSGGTILGCGLILYAAAFGHDAISRWFSQRVYAAVRTFGLLLYAGLYGYYIFLGANGLPCAFRLSLAIDLAVGLVVACTVYGFFSLFQRGEI